MLADNDINLDEESKNDSLDCGSSVNTEISKKRRFAEVENKDLDAIVENSQAKRTKKQQNGQFPFLQVGFNYTNNPFIHLFPYPFSFCKRLN